MLCKLPYFNKISPQSSILWPPTVTCHVLYAQHQTYRDSFLAAVGLYDRCAVRARQEFRTITSSCTRCAVYITVSYFLLGHGESEQIDYQHRTAAAHQEGYNYYTIQRCHHPFGPNSKLVDAMRLPSMVQGSCHGWGSISFLGNFKPQFVVQVQSTLLFYL